MVDTLENDFKKAHGWLVSNGLNLDSYAGLVSLSLTSFRRANVHITPEQAHKIGLVSDQKYPVDETVHHHAYADGVEVVWVTDDSIGDI